MKKLRKQISERIQVDTKIEVLEKKVRYWFWRSIRYENKYFSEGKRL